MGEKKERKKGIKRKNERRKSVFFFFYRIYYLLTSHIIHYTTFNTNTTMLHTYLNSNLPFPLGWIGPRTSAVLSSHISKVTTLYPLSHGDELTVRTVELSDYCTQFFHEFFCFNVLEGIKTPAIGRQTLILLRKEDTCKSLKKKKVNFT